MSPYKETSSLLSRVTDEENGREDGTECFALKMHHEHSKRHKVAALSRATAVFGVILLCAGSVAAFLESRSNIQLTMVSISSNATANIYHVAHKYDSHIYAIGTYNTNVSNNGWNYFEVKTFPRDNGPKEHIKAMKAAGYLEGYATCKQMKQFYENYAQSMFGADEPDADVVQFITDNYHWVTKQAAENYLSSDYWLAVHGIISQLHGILDGYIAGCPSDDGAPMSLLNLRRPSLTHLLLLNANGDLYQITQKFSNYIPPSDHHKRKPTWGWIFPKNEKVSSSAHSSMFRMSKNKKRTDHCSAIIKLAADSSDVFFGHNTWDDYQCAAPRIIKRYHFTLPSLVKESIKSLATAPVYNVYFSSSPGMLSSIDDFYSVQGLGTLSIIETSLDIYDPELLPLISSSSVLCWMRSRLANRLARNGSEWATIFSTHASGTYTNQWMVLDLTRIVRSDTGIKLLEGFLTVTEEMPGYVHSEDKTEHLKSYGYWASYNIPYFVDIAMISGTQTLCQKDPSNCYSSDPRARLFRKYQSSVSDISSLQHLLSRNDFLNDADISLKNSCNSIACRDDLQLNVTEQSPFGAIDAKAASVLGIIEATRVSSNAKDESPSLPVFYARQGPTHDQQAPFCWSNFVARHGVSLEAFAHKGHPDCFNFSWQPMPPVNHKALYSFQPPTMRNLST